MKIKLKYKIGKEGDYPANIWLKAKDLDGFIRAEGLLSKELRMIHRLNIKECKET